MTGLTQDGTYRNTHPVHGVVVEIAQALHDELGTPEPVKVHILEDPVGADGEEDVLLQLLVLGKLFHG